MLPLPPRFRLQARLPGEPVHADPVPHTGGAGEPAARARQLSRAGRVGLALLALHVVLLFLPALPPDLMPYMKPGGSLWSYLIGYAAVILLLLELRRSPYAVLAWWRRARPARRWAAGGMVVAAAISGTLALRAFAPERFARFSGEEGLWEPLTLFCYLGAALLLQRAAQCAADARRKPVQLAAGLFLLLALEEIDYFGIFGAAIGYIDGVYTGSLHDLVRLAAEGILTPAATLGLLGALLLLLALLRRGGYLSAAGVRELLGTRAVLWVLPGLAFLVAAAAVEAELLGWGAASPSAEEALELVGSLCLTLYALELAPPPQ